jgi:hypothetical protein
MKIFKSIKIEALLLLALIAAGSFSCKKSSVSPSKKQVTLVNDSITQNGLTLIFINKDTAFQLSGDSVRKAYEKIFFIVYPKIMAYFNPNAPKKVTFLMDPTYDGIAATSNATTFFDPGNSLDHPKDLNVIAHEVTHIVQQYTHANQPGWITEGIADYSKEKFGVPYGFDGWYIADYQVGDQYTTGYAVIARFILWAEAKYNRPMVQIIDKAMRDGNYDNDSTWQELTGSTFDQLWDSYTSNPYF